MEEQKSKLSLYETYDGEGWICKQCDKLFLKYSNFEVHQRRHIRYRPFRCEMIKVKNGQEFLCGKRFLTKSDYNRHVRLSHSQFKSYICRVCNKTYKYLSSLKTHQRIHKKEMKYKCPHQTCQKEFTNQAHLNYHKKKVHTMKPHKGAPRKHVVHRHQASEDDEKIKCDHKGCNLKFGTLREKQMHHDRYFKNCPIEKKQTRKRILRTKNSIKKTRKENTLLIKLLASKGINYMAELRQLKQDKEKMQSIEQNAGDETPPEYLHSTSTMNQTFNPEWSNVGGTGMLGNYGGFNGGQNQQRRNISGLIRKNRQRIAQKKIKQFEENSSLFGLDFDDDLKSDTHHS